MIGFPLRRGGRVVDCDGLENRWACKRPVSSNLTPSAISQIVIVGYRAQPVWPNIATIVANQDSRILQE